MLFKMTKLLVHFLCFCIPTTFAIINPEFEPNWIEYPFVVRLFLGMKPHGPPFLMPICVGSLIHPNRVITVAHCIESEIFNKELFVMFVEHLSFTSPTQANHRFRLVTNASIAPEYANNSDIDIAVLHLEKLPNDDETVQWIGGFHEVDLQTNLTWLGFKPNFGLNRTHYDKPNKLAQAFPKFFHSKYHLNFVFGHPGDSGSPIIEVESKKLVSFASRRAALTSYSRVFTGPYLIKHLDFITKEIAETYEERKAHVNTIENTFGIYMFLYFGVKYSFRFSDKKVTLFGSYPRVSIVVSWCAYCLEKVLYFKYLYSCLYLWIGWFDLYFTG